MPQTRHALDLDPGLAAKLRGRRLEPGQAARRATQVASNVPANKNLDIRRRLRPEMREEADDFVNPVQRNLQPRRKPLELFPRQVASTFLNRTKLPDEHQTSRQSVEKGESAFDAVRRKWKSRQPSRFTRREPIKA